MQPWQRLGRPAPPSGEPHSFWQLWHREPPAPHSVFVLPAMHAMPPSLGTRQPAQQLPALHTPPPSGQPVPFGAGVLAHPVGPHTPAWHSPTPPVQSAHWAPPEPHCACPLPFTQNPPATQPVQHTWL